MPLGEEGAASWDCDSGFPNLFVAAAGEVGWAMPDGVGDAVLGAYEGEIGRARRDTGATAGLPDRGIPPRREAMLGAGDAERAVELANLDACVTGTSALSGELGPATRRKRSSSCVLSFGDSVPTSCQIFSPTKTYPSLQKSASYF